MYQYQYVVLHLSFFETLAKTRRTEFFSRDKYADTE